MRRVAAFLAATFNGESFKGDDFSKTNVETVLSRI